MFSSDADPRLFGAMKKMTGFGKRYDIRGLCTPLICNINSGVFALSDVHHLLNNFKNRMTDPTSNLKIGKFFVSSNFLKILINLPNISRNDHLLRAQDVGTFDMTKDKMNTESTKRICEPIVIELLSKVPGSQGTSIYLKVMRAIYDSFINTETNDLDRLFYAFYSLSILRRWRKTRKFH